MTEFNKLASAITMWGWGRSGMILATALLFRHVVTFDQAVILILLNVVLDRLVYGKRPSPRPQKRSSAATAENRRRPRIGGGRNCSGRSNPDRSAPAGGLGTARAPGPRPRKNGNH